MKYKTFIPAIFVFFAFLVNVNGGFSQLNLTEKELVGNWSVTGGSGPDFDKELIGWVFTFQKDHKVSRREEGETIVSDWKFENNVITISYNYNDGKNEPEIETLTITAFDGKKWTANYTNLDEDVFTLSFERTKMP